MNKTAIPWTDATWNPVTGCTKVSPGCAHCYAEELSIRRGGPAGFRPTFHPARLAEPKSARAPRRIFVGSMSDLFHEDFTFAQTAAVFDVMAAASQHAYQVLTKRPERMRDFVARWLAERGRVTVPPWIWPGVSVEMDRYVGRVDVLREIPAALRFVSAEPLLGPLPSLSLDGVGWLIVGGESGERHRPMDDAWARDLLATARASRVPFFFKQHAGWREGFRAELDGVVYHELPGAFADDPSRDAQSPCLPFENAP